MRVLLVDDHSLFLEGVSNLLTAHQYKVVGKASNGHEALKMTRKLKPDLILMDINMDNVDGLAATKLIKNEFPQIKVVILTISADDEMLIKAIRNRADGYLLKNLEADKFISLLEKLSEGEPPLAPGMTSKLMRKLSGQNSNNEGLEKNKDNSKVKVNRTYIKAKKVVKEEMEIRKLDLTDRQEEILTLIICGKSYQEIADIIAISEATVKYHMRRIITNNNLNNRAEAIALAQKYGLGAI